MKVLGLAVVSVFVFGLSAVAGKVDTSLPNEALRQTLVEMGREDQAASVGAARGQPVTDEAAHTKRRIALLKQIIQEFGWPGLRLVGEDGATGAWIVAQHADDEPAFQEQCLVLVKAGYAAHDVPGFHLAYLTDRVAIAFHRPQTYGTQGAPVYTLSERNEVDARRAQLGLPTMAETARQRSAMYQEKFYSSDAGLK